MVILDKRLGKHYPSLCTTPLIYLHRCRERAHFGLRHVSGESVSPRVSTVSRLSDAQQSSYPVPNSGIAPVAAPNGYFGTVLLLPYINVNIDRVETEASVDGKTYTIGGGSPIGPPMFGNCFGEVNYHGCSLASIVFNGRIIVALAGDDQTLNVYELSPIQGTSAYADTLLYNNQGIHLTSAPAMVVSPNGHLLIRYGTNANPKLKNATYVTQYDGANFSTYASNGLAPTQSAVVNLNGQLIAMDGQDNSDHGVFTTLLDQNGYSNNTTTRQVPGWYTQSGISAVVFKNNIVAAFQQDSSAHHMWIFSSPDANSWAGQQYPNTENFTLKLALFNGGVGAVTIANDSSYLLFTDYTTQ